MDYERYVLENVKDQNTRERILGEIKEVQRNHPCDWVSWFINNFHSYVNPASSRRKIQCLCGRTLITESSTFGEFDYSDKISEKLKRQTVDQFYKTIDGTIAKLCISQEELVKDVDCNSVGNLQRATDNLMKIMIELMSQGYNRYPDLAR